MRLPVAQHRASRSSPRGSWCARPGWISCALFATFLAAQPALAAPPDGDVPARTPAPASSDAAEASAGRRPSTPTRAATLESTRRALAAATLRQQLVPTLDNERQLAQEYAKAGVLDAAVDRFDAALRLDPHDVPSLDGLARIWRDWGFLDAALPYAYRAVYWGPASAAAQNTLGTILLRLRLPDAARRRFETARALDPAAAYPLNNLCHLERLRGNLDAAAALCREAAARDAASPVIRNNLALVLAAGGDMTAALATFAAHAPPAAAAYNQGMLLVAAGDMDGARDAFARARIADPGFAPAFARLAQLARVTSARGAAGQRPGN